MTERTQIEMDGTKRDIAERFVFPKHVDSVSVKRLADGRYVVTGKTSSRHRDNERA